MGSTDGFVLRHRLVVATPTLADPNFADSVVLVVEHGPDDGALGVVLNRPTDTELSGPLLPWEHRAAPPAVIFEGGPVSPNAALCLARLPAAGDTDGFEHLFSGVGTLDLDRDPALLHPALDLRLFAGYAGWGTGQLEAEIASGAWFAVDARPDDAFTGDPDGLWRAVLRRQRGSLAMFANHPVNPSLN